MSHPETYYEAKAALLAAAATASEHLSPRSVDSFLAALGWAAPAPARENGRLVKVYAAYDLRTVLPDEFRKTHIVPGYNLRFEGVFIAASKRDAGEKSLPSWVTGRDLTAGISEVDPTDLRYPLAIENRDQVVITVSASGSPDSAPILFPLHRLRTGR